MPRPRTANTTRSHHKKPADPALEAMVDTISDDTNPDEVKASSTRARTQKAGPKKVISETTKMVGEGVAIGVLLATKNADARKSLTMPEAQSIGHPIVRMLARRVPAWVKPYLPKTKMDPDDAADVEEILATLAKWGMRLVTVMVTDFVVGKEEAQAKKQYDQVRMGGVPIATPAPAPAPFVEDELPGVAGEHAPSNAPTRPSSNGHNPAFDVLNAMDLGIEVV